MNLVVVESPSKAKTINKYLGKDFVVMASKGHIIDLPKSKMSIDVDNDFKPDYVVTNQKSLDELKKSFKQADKLILAVDLDREGEAIGWHVAQALKVIDENGKPLKNSKPVERIVFNEITKDAIENAISKPRKLDMNLVNAQQARRLLDRLVGYKLSPLLWKKISFGLSAGRVQSVAVRLIVEREDERNKFNKEEYWSVEANLSKDKNNNVSVKYQLTDRNKEEDDEINIKEGLINFQLSKIKGKQPDLKKQEECEKIVAKISNKDWIVSEISSSQSTKKTKPPFITSTLQQTGVNWLGFSAKRTMGAAQKLYEAGLITYMRTDSVHMSEGAVKQAKKYTIKNFGDKYYPSKENIYASGKSAQEAHECIRPSDFNKTGKELNLEGDLLRVYELIWQRALASQMAPSILESSSITISIEDYEFKANGKRIVFDGYLRVYPERQSENILPKINKGEELFPNDILSRQHFTQPPARFSEATLIKKLEELGIGRPSTYASIISTIIQRKYVEEENKYLRPTDTGIVVNKLLEKYFNNIVDYNFTANMEGDLDKVAEGNLDWIKMLKDFYKPFEKKIIEEDKNISRTEFTELGKSDVKCPLDGGDMIIKLGRFGKFLSCKNYPTCKGILKYEDPNATPEEKKAAEAELFVDTTRFLPSPKTEDGREFILKQSKYGRFWAHPDYPKVKDAKPLMLIETCPESGHNLVERKGKWGKTFIGCSDYPKCKYIKK